MRQQNPGRSTEDAWQLDHGHVAIFRCDKKEVAMRRTAALFRRIGQLSKYLVVDGVGAIRDSWYAMLVHLRHLMH